MIRVEKRNVEVKYCDFCGEEAEHIDKCAICKREMCLKHGGATHSAFNIEVYSYSDEQRLAGYGSNICNDCAGKKFNGTIRDLIKGMMGKDIVPLT